MTDCTAMTAIPNSTAPVILSTETRTSEDGREFTINVGLEDGRFYVLVWDDECPEEEVENEVFDTLAEANAFSKGYCSAIDNA